MKILVANNHLHTVGGSESFTWAMADELTRMGHEVDVLDARGMIYRAASVFIPGQGDYDAAFISHHTTARWLFANYPDMDPRRVVQTVHGVASALETPYKSRPIKHVAVSRELGDEFGFSVIENAVDLERFRPNKEKRGVLSLCQSREINAMIELVCSSIGVPFSFREKSVNPIPDIWSEMNAAQVVVGIGRSAIEAMASGCAVVAADARSYQGAWSDGVLTPANYQDLMRCNLSGRATRGGVNFPSLKRDIETALRCNGQIMRGIAEEHHDIRKAAARYFEILEQP